jgi:hypothetical protein
MGSRLEVLYPPSRVARLWNAPRDAHPVRRACSRAGTSDLRPAGSPAPSALVAAGLGSYSLYPGNA